MRRADDDSTDENTEMEPRVMSSANTHGRRAMESKRGRLQRRWWLGALAAAAVIAGSGGAAFALTLSHAQAVSSLSSPRAPKDAATAKLELVLLFGTKGDKESIPADYPELKNPPWNAYNHYQVLLTRTLALTQGTASKESLPDGSALETTLLEPTQTTKFRLEVVVKDAKGAQVSKGTYSAPQGKHFLPLQVPYKGGGLVVSLKVT